MRTVVKNIGQLATPLSDGSVAVTRDAVLSFVAGKIEFVGPGRDFGEPADETYDAAGGVVLPGFVDAHTHLVFGGHRAQELELRARGQSYGEIKAAGGGIMSTVQATRGLGQEDLLAIGLKHLAWCVRAGTTTLEAKSGYGLDLSTELDILLALHNIDLAFASSTGLKTPRVVSTFLGLHAVPEGAETDSFVEDVIDRWLPAVHGAGLATYVDAFVEQGYFSPDQCRMFVRAAQKLGFSARLHVDQLTVGGGAALAVELGASTADHMEQTVDFIPLIDSDTIPVLLPGSVLGLGLNKYADARALLDAGSPVVLATDFNPGTSPTPSLPFVMALAARHMRMTPEECLKAVTDHAARSLGLHDRGRLEPGLLADFSVWPLVDWREVIQWIDGPRPVSVWAAGTKITA
ncbi:MAG: imidazolonepropionase [Chthonomonadaceae bacterium]|nr:imidazolonepropionase [Chthonomonadaceae bacterium]